MTRRLVPHKQAFLWPVASQNITRRYFSPKPSSYLKPQLSGRGKNTKVVQWYIQKDFRKGRERFDPPQTQQLPVYTRCNLTTPEKHHRSANTPA